MSPLTLFSFGYHGWGNATPQLVEMIDAVERSRGFAPPLFVDTRIRRSVRACGFNGPAFEKLLGPERHRWMKSLGNRRILTGRGPPLQIDRPESAAELLDLAAPLESQRRRLLFFCRCPWPREQGRVTCHRTEVGRLLLETAARDGRRITVVEWPGGEPGDFTFELSGEQGRAAAKRRFIPLPEPVDLARVGAIPWASRAAFRTPGTAFARLVGPAARQAGTWALPVLAAVEEDDAVWHRQALRLRRSFGLEALPA